MKHPESDGSRLCAALPPAGTDVWFSWLAVFLDQDWNGASPPILLKTSGQLTLTGHSAEEQTRHNDFLFTDGELSRYFAIVIGEVTADLCVIPGSHVYVHCTESRKKLLTETFVVEERDVLPTSVFMRHG